MLGGFVAGEGCFTRCAQPTTFADGQARQKFVFIVEVAECDRGLLDRLAEVLGCGSIAHKSCRRDHLPSVAFSVRSHKTHHERTIPFMDRYLLPCAKRDQFAAWRKSLAEYERAHPTRWGRGPSTCLVDDCTGLVRGRGLCRRHYYRATGY